MSHSYPRRGLKGRQMGLAVTASRRDLRGASQGVPFVGDDAALIQGLRTGNPSAGASLCERYGPHALRVLARILGDDSELEDLQQDVLLRAMRSAATVEHAASLKGWISIIAVNVARTTLKRRALRRWLTLRPWNELPEVEAPDVEEEILALRRTYALLGRMAAMDRIVFALRIIEGMELAELAEACEISLATAKRRLARAEQRFTAMASKDPILGEWLKGGSRWGTR